ncbi:MAG: hypothetical protein HYU86_07345 [Chloroflexi bacterium]|nr:hypothetical protein [Chloroflexota bacterium]
MADQELRARVKTIFGYSDDQMAALRPRQWQSAAAFAKLSGWRLVAEVEEAHHCAAKLSPGQRLVLSAGGTVLASQCTAKLCLWALAPLVPFTFMLIDRLMAGQEPGEMWYDHFRCLDVGMECGGFGTVLFRVKAEGD